MKDETNIQYLVRCIDCRNFIKKGDYPFGFSLCKLAGGAIPNDILDKPMICHLFKEKKDGQLHLHG